MHTTPQKKFLVKPKITQDSHFKLQDWDTYIISAQALPLKIKNIPPQLFLAYARREWIIC